MLIKGAIGVYPAQGITVVFPVDTIGVNAIIVDWPNYSARQQNSGNLQHIIMYNIISNQWAERWGALFCVWDQRDLDKMAAILQSAFSNAFPETKCVYFDLNLTMCRS